MKNKLKEIKSLAEAIALGKHFPKEGYTELDIVKELAEEIVELTENILKEIGEKIVWK